MSARPAHGAYGRLGPVPGFTWSEVRCTDGTLPTGPLFRRRVVRQARQLNLLRASIAKRFKVPTSSVSIVVNSWYRSPAYNKRIGGASRSEHMTGRATDVQIIVRLRNGKRVKLTPSFVGLLAERYVAAFRKGGIGRYTTFTHLDCRGYTSRWNGP